MKRNGIFPGILLIGIGAIFLLQKLDFPFLAPLFTWPSILVAIGLALLFQILLGREYNDLFPGTLLLALGIHFHGLQLFSFWPNHWTIFTLIVGLSFLARYSKTKKDGLVPGLSLVVLSLLALFYTGFVGWLGAFFTAIERFWPLALIALGTYFVIFKRK